MSRSRAPGGVVTRKPIGLRLLPEERTEVEAMAEKENRTLANMCRHLVLMGVEQLHREAEKGKERTVA